MILAHETWWPIFSTSLSLRNLQTDSESLTVVPKLADQTNNGLSEPGFWVSCAKDILLRVGNDANTFWAVTIVNLFASVIIG